MANLYPACDSLLESEANRLLALGCFAVANGTKKAKLADGSTMEVEKTSKLRLPPVTINPECRLASINEDLDTLAVDGIAGSPERIENLAQFYRDNGDELDRRGNTIKPAKASPCVLTDSEECDRIIELIPEWAGMPQTELTPFQRFMIELAAESALDMAGMQKLIQEQLGS